MLLVNCKSRSLSVDGNEMAYRYFSDIRKFKKLTNEEQKDLIFLVKHGNREESDRARRTLIECNQRFVASIAKHLTNGDNFNDLVSEGTIGLNKAIDKFDITFKQNFITYAVFWINKYMIDYLIGDDKLITPKNANKVYAYVAAANNKFFLENCRYPTLEELQDILLEQGVIFSNKDDLMQPTMISVDEIDPDYCDNDPYGLFKLALTHEYDESTKTNNIDDEINKEHIKTVAERFLSYLNEKQQFIVRRYYGIGCDPETFQMIANRLETETRNVSREYNNAITKIRKKLGLQISDKK